MTGVGRLRLLALSVLLIAAVLVVFGPRAWATVHQTQARCDRLATNAHVVSRVHTVAASGGSWRAHTLGVGGCGAWRHMHVRIHHQRH